MEKYLLRISCLIIGLLFSIHIVKGQESSDNSTYYYNNFETAVAGNISSLGVSAARVAGSGTSVDAAASTALEGNVCLSSTSTNTSSIGTIGWNFVGNGTTGVNLNSNDWEWDFVYKNGSTSPNDNPDLYATGKNAWRYWLITSTSSYAGNNTKGFYITHYGTSLYLNYRDPVGGSFKTILNITLPNDQNPYIIKVQRLKNSNAWTIYFDVYTAGMTTAKTQQGTSVDGTGSAVSTYYHNYLEVSSTSAARFQFDKFDMYTRLLTFVGANSVTNGITPTPYTQNQTVIYYGVQVQSRGNFSLSNYMYFGVTGTVLSGGSYFNATGSLYRSNNSFYSISSDGPPITNTVQLNGSGSTGIYATGVSDVIASSGNTDGTVNIPCYYFLTATTSATLNYGNTPLTSFTVTGPTTVEQLNNNTLGVAFSNTSTTSPAITFATGIDWTGTTNNKWNTGTNWSGGSKPSGTQTARIGVVTYGANDPKLDASSSPGNIIFGTTKSVSVDLAGFTLSTASVIQNSNPTYSAARKTTITNSSATAGTFTTSSLTNNDNFVFANGVGITNINITGNYTNNLSMTIGSANPVTFNSSGAQTLFDLNTTLGTGTNFNNVNFSGGGTATIINGDFGVINTGILTLSGGSDLAINSAGSLTLYAGTTSPFLNYAQIATIPSGSTIQGNINYQVYFTGGSGFRNYRSMGSPVYDFPTTYNSSNGSYKYSNFISKFIITGASGATNGFDKSTNNGATLRTWNPTTNNYSFITTLSPSPTVATGTGFYLYFRGDRTKTGTLTAADPYGSKTNKANGAGGAYAIPEAVTYTYTGIPNQGAVSTQFGTDDVNYYFISNPYAATLDADALINSTDYTGTIFGISYAANYIATKIWTWKPGATAQYAIWDQTNPTASPNNAKQYIVPGQGFFVQANTNSAIPFFGVNASPNKLTLTESMKSTGNSSNAVRQLSAQAQTPLKPLPILRLQFHKDNITNDEIGMVFQDSTKAAYDKHDAVHFDGTALTLSSLTDDNKYLAIDYRPFTNNKTVIPLYITAETDTTYSLNLSYKNDLMQNYKITLYDSLLNTYNVISKNAYSFQVTNSQAATYGKRFKLIIEPSYAPALFTKFTGKLNELKKVLLNWNSINDRSNITYQVQRSTDKKAFTNIGLPLSSSADNSNPDYQTLDNAPAIGMNYYRLVQTDMFNNAVYSDTVAIAFNPGLLNGIAKNGFILYPNSVKDVLSLVSDKDYNDKVTMTIFDSQGNLKLTQAYQGISGQLPIQENVSRLQLGVYIIHLVSNGKELVTLKFNKEQN